MDQLPSDKTMRSVFVGNIPYEVTEEKLKDIFSEVGPVVSFKLVYDRDTGKPKGYGFCEYKDPETAMCAMRNLNCYEIGGRNLRVDNACTERSRMEMQSLMLSGTADNRDNDYGDAVNPEKAADVISRTVSMLSPELLIDAMKQVKENMKNDPDEMRMLLLQNPQLAYALLQALVMMGIIDPQTGLSMLHAPNSMPNCNVSSTTGDGLPAWNNSNRSSNQAPLMPHMPPPAPPLSRDRDDFESRRGDFDTRRDLDARRGDFDGRRGDFDLRKNDFDLDMRKGDLDMRMRMDQDLRMPPNIMNVPYVNEMFRRDPRLQQHNMDANRPPPMMMPPPPINLQQLRSGSSGPPPSSLDAGIISPAILNMLGATQDKHAMILHVLKLSDEQIANLPTDQRKSVLALREQIKNAQR